MVSSWQFSNIFIILFLTALQAFLAFSFCLSVWFHHLDMHELFSFLIASTQFLFCFIISFSNCFHSFLTCFAYFQFDFIIQVFTSCLLFHYVHVISITIHYPDFHELFVFFSDHFYAICFSLYHKIFTSCPHSFLISLT